MFYCGLHSLCTEKSKRLMMMFNKGLDALNNEFDIVTIIRRERDNKEEKHILDIDKDSSEDEEEN